MSTDSAGFMEVGGHISTLFEDDPAVTSVLAQARLYQDYLDAFGSQMTDAEVHQMVVDLDRQWPYRNVGGIFITGKTTCPVVNLSEDLESADDETQPAGGIETTVLPAEEYDETRLEDAEVISHGFVVGEAPLIIDGTDFGKRKVIKMLFERAVQIADSKGEVKKINIAATAEPDDIIVQYPYGSPKYEERQLEELMPELMQQVDEILLNAESREQALMRLGEITIPLSNGYTPADFNPLARYVERTLDLDTTPLFITTKPNQVLFEFTDEGSYGGRLLDSETMLVQPHSIMFQSFVDINEIAEGQFQLIEYPDKFAFCLVGTIQRRDGGNDVLSGVLPLSSIASVMNSRDLLEGV